MRHGRHFAEFRLGRIEPAGSWLAVGVVGADFDPREEAFSGIGHLHAQGSEEGWVLNTTDGQLDHEGGGFEWEGMQERGELKEHDRIGFLLDMDAAKYHSLAPVFARLQLLYFTVSVCLRRAG